MLCWHRSLSHWLYRKRASAQQPKPNILFILADNIGYGDIGAYGGGELRGAPTPRIDRLAAESLRLTQFLVEPSLHAVARCADDRALFDPLRAVAGCGRRARPISLAGDAKSPWPRCCATPAMPPRSSANGISAPSPTASRRTRASTNSTAFRRRDTWDAFGMIRQGRQTKALDMPLDKGPQIVAAKRGEPLRTVKPYTEEVRREIDWELVDHGVDFMKRQKAASKPFFLYLPISRTHFPNLPSKRFEGASRIGQFGDSLMEGDAVVGKMLDTLKELGLEKDTIVVFASDNGPDGPGARTFGGDMPDIGSPGPYRGALGDVSEGSIRTAAMIRWPDRIATAIDPTRCSRSWISSRRSRASAAARCRTTGRSTASTRADLLLGTNDTGPTRALADLRRPRSRRGSLEAIPRLFCRCGARPQRLGWRNTSWAESAPAQRR